MIGMMIQELIPQPWARRPIFDFSYEQKGGPWSYIVVL
jgi:hypothetical protein